MAVLALVSHDIRNPLTAIGMGAQLILRTPGQSEKHRPILLRMLHSLEQADSMIQSLLDVVRIRAGKSLPLDFQNCDLSLQVSLMVEDMSLIGNDRLKFTADEAIWGSWGISGIRRALENVVSNAIKYGDSKTPITIHLSRRDGNVVLSIHNQGPAIPIEDQVNLFEAFQRTSSSENSSTRGWGLGLALVKGIAEAHEGTVKVESSKNQGTTFTLELPIRNPEKSVSIPVSPPSPDMTY